ncbi:hypothetical protein Lal_00000958 [Lupinus albus]|nr:hypothetical protein Lal_00000958 [Lupinus albus]
MASRPIVPIQQQAKGEGVGGGGKQQKNSAVDGKNRKALGDIGNLDLVKGVEIKPNRPITRSFYAQLLANAQVAAAAENNKKLDIPNVADEVDAKREAPKPAEKKVTAKPKHREVIEINPNEGGENKKKSQTFTSVLTTISKVDKKNLHGSDSSGTWSETRDLCTFEPYCDVVSLITSNYGFLLHTACGLTKKPKEQIIDIDAGDIGNELATIFTSSISLHSMKKCAEIFWFNILQLLVDDFVCISDSAFTHEQILVMEKIILGKLEWTLIMPTPYVFLVCFIKASVLDQEYYSCLKKL